MCHTVFMEGLPCPQKTVGGVGSGFKWHVLCAVARVDQDSVLSILLDWMCMFGWYAVSVNVLWGIRVMVYELTESTWI